ncbi:MAG TPA: MBL fold metallo-hydrolase [Bacteroidales bacterium]|nr:MBL fold metallo-hydrolase [Bacteroidales bacterium]
MKLYVLTENTASDKFIAEHGLSYYIEYDVNVLFDTGHSDVFLKNSKKLGIHVDQADAVVLSHGHWDHGDGLRYISNKKLICHPDVFQKRYRKGGKENIGLELSFNELKSKFDILYTRLPFEVSENIIFLGEVPRLNSFESKTTSFALENNTDDFIPDDSGLVIKLEKEIIIISGCAHSGICNMIEYSKKITGIQKIRAVIGGFHLKYNDHQTQETINFLKKQDIKDLYPSHCTELPALCAFYNEFKIKHLKAGMILNF